MKSLFFALALLLTTTSFFAQSAQSTLSPEERGLEIAKAAETADLGFNSSIVELKMILKNKNGQTSERALTTKTLELTEDGDKSMIVFKSPKDVKGTASLTYTHKKGADDQWLYLPAVKRVKRISSNNKSGPFVGSEFAYEDLSSQEVEKYSYKFLEAKGSLLMVEQDPVDPKSGYTRRVVAYNADRGYRIESIEFYDRKNALVAADVLNDRVVPFYEQHEIPVLRILTDRGTEYCGKREQHEYQLYLAIEDIDHTRTKARSPQTNGICERFHRTIQDEFYAIAFRKKIYSSLEQLQTDLDLWLDYYNGQRTHSGKHCNGRVPMQPSRKTLKKPKRKCFHNCPMVLLTYLRLVKRKQAMVETNLPGIVSPTEMKKGQLRPLFCKTFWEEIPEKTQSGNPDCQSKSKLLQLITSVYMMNSLLKTTEHHFN